MKKIFYTFMAMTAALSVVGCAKELEESAQTSGNAPEEESGYIVLGAYLPDSEDPAGDTKTTISKNEGKSSYSVFWAEGDAISVNGRTSTAINIDQANRKNASFTLPASVKAPYCAVYPAGAYIGGTYTAGTDTLDIKVPSEQKYVKDGIDPNSAIMLAYSKDGKTLGFSHAMAYLKLAVNTDVKSVRINGNNNDAVSGTYKYSVSDKGDVDFMAQMNSLNKATTPNTSIVYSAGDDSFVPAGESMFIAIPAILYQNGFTLTIVNKDNKYQVVKSNTDTPFEAVGGKVYTTTVTFKENGTYVDGGIYTVEDWNAFVAAVNSGDWSAWKKTIDGKEGVHLMADIYSSTNLPRTNDKYLEGEKKGNTCMWDGTFYGHNHIITHAGFEPLFLHVGSEGVIQDLIVAGERTRNSLNGWTGSIVLNNAGEIRNCENRMNITLSGANTNAAGICRTNTGTVVGCKNTGKITISNPTAAVNVAGIVMTSTDSGKLVNCTNEGAITITGVNVNCVVAGVVQSVGGKNVSDLSNKAPISIEANLTAAREIYMGGVAAKEYSVTNEDKTVTYYPVYFNKCSNSGALKITKSGAFHMKGGAIGGIIAAINYGVYSSSKEDQGVKYTAFDNCSNSGSIAFYESERGGCPKPENHGAYAVGGILGRCVGLNSAGYYNVAIGYYTVIRVTCANTGTIDVCTANGQAVGNNTSGARQTFAGAIAGFVSGGTTTSVVRGNTTNQQCAIKVGSVSGGICAGGILGGGYKVNIDGGSNANVNFTVSDNSFITPEKVGYVGAVLGWAASTVNITKTAASASFDFNDSLKASNFASGFAGVKTGVTLTVAADCTYQGVKVETTDIYGGGTKKIN